MGSARRFVVGAAAALAIVALLAAPSAGERRLDPIAHIACAPNAPPPCSEMGTDMLPPMGLGSEHTDLVPNTATSATEDVEPATPQDVAAFDSMWETIVQDQPKLANIKSVPVRRFVTCHVFSQTAVAFGLLSRDTPVDNQEATFSAGYLLAMGACLDLVASLQRTEAAMGNHPVADAAASSCDQIAVRLPIMVSRAGGSYAMSINATGPSAARRSQLSVSCHRTSSGGVLIGVKPTKRGAPLGRAVGPNLQVGFANASTSSVSVRTTYTFH